MQPKRNHDATPLQAELFPPPRPFIVHQPSQFERTAARLIAAEEAYRASGGLEGKEVSHFYHALNEAGYEYEGYTVNDNGSRIYRYSAPATGRMYTVHVARWDGSASGLSANAKNQDLEWSRLLSCSAAHSRL